MKNTVKQYGFQAPVIEKNHYIFGAEMVPRIVYQPDGQWLDYITQNEKQYNDLFDTCGCTVYGTLNAGLEILGKRVFGKENNYSDRFTYIASGTKPPGNDPQIVAESIRASGVVAESDLPFSNEIDSLDKFNCIPPDKKYLIDTGKLWATKYEFLHEWVFNSEISLSEKQNRMVECLTFSPLGVSVRAWQQRENGLYYKELGEQDTHWCVCIGYVVGKYWIIYDSYPQSDGDFIKHLEWDYDFGFAKRYYLKEITEPIIPIAIPKKISLYQRFINWLDNIIKTWTVQPSTL
jgi:hypothetical protein